MSKAATMTEGTIWKQILFFSIPLILGNLFQQLYNTVDSIIVGNYIGSNALAAVGASSSIISLLISFCIGASAGAGVVISQCYGAQREDGIHKAVHTTVAIAAAMGVIMTLVGVLFTPAILRIMGTPKEVFAEAVVYLQVFFGGIVFSVIYNMCAGILNAVGNSRRSLIYLIIAATSNIFLDLLFVVVFKMGIIGAALATDISQLLSCIFIMTFLVKSKALYRVKLKEVRFYQGYFSRIVRLGLPTGIQNIVISLSNVIVQASVNSFGSVVMAGFAAYIKIDGFNILPVLSIGMAASTFTGQNVGAGKFDRVKKGIRVSVAMGVIYTTVTGILLMAFAPQVIGIFSQDPEVVKYGVYVLKYFCPYYWLLGILQTLTGTVRGAGKTMQAMVVFLVAFCIYRVTWIGILMPLHHELGLLMTVYPTSWVVGVLMILAYVWKGKWLPVNSGISEKA